MMHCSGWSGVYDLQKRAVAKTLDPGRITTAGEDAGETLNQVYRELRSLVDKQDKESLRLEELASLNKRDAIKSLQEKNVFTNFRVTELEDRIQKLRK
jgi:hypothetical protein